MAKKEHKQRIERLQQLRRVVQETPDAEFDMNHWKCGTTACAAGRAACDPWFTRRGLTLETDAYSGDAAYPVFDDAVGFSALAGFFRITDDESDRLFDPWFYENGRNGRGVERHEVIERIDEVIEKYSRA